MVKVEEYVVRTVPSICILCQNVILNERSNRIQVGEEHFILCCTKCTMDMGFISLYSNLSKRLRKCSMCWSTPTFIFWSFSLTVIQLRHNTKERHALLCYSKSGNFCCWNIFIVPKDNEIKHHENLIFSTLNKSMKYMSWSNRVHAYARKYATVRCLLDWTRSCCLPLSVGVRFVVFSSCKKWYCWLLTRLQAYSWSSQVYICIAIKIWS